MKNYVYMIRHKSTGRFVRNYAPTGARFLLQYDVDNYKSWPPKYEYYSRDIILNNVLQSKRCPSIKVFANRKLLEYHLKMLNRALPTEFEIVERVME